MEGTSERPPTQTSKGYLLLPTFQFRQISLNVYVFFYKLIAKCVLYLCDFFGNINNREHGSNLSPRPPCIIIIFITFWNFSKFLNPPRLRFLLHKMRLDENLPQNYL